MARLVRGLQLGLAGYWRRISDATQVMAATAARGLHAAFACIVVADGSYVVHSARHGVRGG